MLGIPGFGSQSAGIAGGRSAAMGESQGESQNESIGIAAVVVLVCHQRDFLLVIIGTGQTLHPLVTKHLDLLELACGMRSSLVSHGQCGQQSK